MSILLEALRKSEKGQLPVEAPTIHAEQHITMGSERVRRGPLAVLLVLALALIAWIVWRQYAPATETYQPPVALPVKQDGAIKTPVSSMQRADSVTDPGDSARAVAKQQRTPVENYQQAVAKPGKPKPVKPNTAKPIAAKPEADRPKPQVADSKASQTRLAAAEKSGGNDRADETGPQPISYWELPDAIRADVPEIKFSVLVYAGDPADRFVLVNGQRLQEGDSYQQGLVVEEIRRDGVVFSYRLYQFLIER